MTTETNLRVLRPSRAKLRPGHLFVMSPSNRRYLFGRVIRTDALIGPMSGCILIYIYRYSSESKESPPRSELGPDRLLVPPIMINRIPWSRGYFGIMAHLPLAGDDVLDQHCFRDFTGRYYDADNHELPAPVEPVGDYGLASYRIVDDEVSDALGIPRVRD